MWHLCEAAAQPWAAATVCYEAMHVCLRVSVRVDMPVRVFVCTYIILLMSHEEDETPSVRLGPGLVRMTYQSPPWGVLQPLTHCS